MISNQEAAAELLARRNGRRYFRDYVLYTTKNYIVSAFFEQVAAALDQFILDVQAGKRPILILQAPPQHGKSELVSRKLPAFILGMFPEWRIAAASYASSLAYDMGTDVRRNLASPAHKRLFKPLEEKRRYAKDTMAAFTNPHGEGSYIGDGIGGPFTGKSADIFIIDDPIKNAQEALSQVTKESHWNWFQSTSKTRMSANSGLIVMATSWAEDDLSARIAAQFEGDPRLVHLRFPAINDPNETGYNPDFALGPLIPDLHPLTQLLEFKAEMSDYWWSALYQQSAKPIGGNVFKEIGIQYWLPKDLPEKWDSVVDSWDCTFKDTDGTDFVVGQKWGKKGANAYLLFQIRDRMSFTRTLKEVKALSLMNPLPFGGVLIEDKANGPAVIDTLKGEVPGIDPIEPDGSKLARAHAVTSYWEARNVFLPSPTLFKWVKALISELTGFPAAAHDDQVDSLTQALRKLYPLFNKLGNMGAAVKKALGR